MSDQTAAPTEGATREVPLALRLRPARAAALAGCGPG